MGDLELEQLDVKTAFLHGDLEEKIYMQQPEKYEVAGKENHVCLLNKSLYGLKQSPRQWYKKFDVFMASIGFQRSEYDSCRGRKIKMLQCAERRSSQVTEAGLNRSDRNQSALIPVCYSQDDDRRK
ncbi:reverse transcriptase [Rhynchospora pubera]|uniref:Reverse transcriptase n=1 Tax=Rhynchospora pubera TaxID=906938 RepID=A0AAV8GFV2_9POAL|nr:reverse transcriptase [Rhynchospora pubera]